MTTSRTIVLSLLAALLTAAVAVAVATGAVAGLLPGSVAAAPGEAAGQAPTSTSPLPQAPGVPVEPAPTPEPTPEPAPEPPPALHRAGDTGDEVRDLQARLVQIDWLTPAQVTGTYADATTAAVEGFQAKRGLPVTGEVDATTLERLHAMTGPPSDGELHGMPAATGELDPRCREGRVICVDKTTRSLSWVVDGTVLSTLEVRFGGEGTETREGAFTVERKSRDHVSSLYDTAMPFAMFFSGGQAVHYSADFAANGYAGASHGCVNVRDRDGVEALFDEVRVGDAVVVHRS
ncbi:L,D-transpeptidase family protein [Nocardioides zeae]|uniref:L,D-transpeptidase family protein n=1 Tax=Nocardioides imazamoxiresistens TaxID=3231893 RepID=A0ABU3Q001_9ACTN|nr:L,D-transpeptidase family protein [Nocardioides zeae]MDT9594836.1 L,D-transpeptidase family protein [Nocardioides zeae]